MKEAGFDIIGDIHGHADALIKLLTKLGYKKEEGLFSHDSRKVIFLGDFIDRLEHQKSVINIARKMVENNKAFAIMGNHEFNAICYHSFDDDRNALREHSDKNTEQHQAFLDEYPLGEKETNEIINWFKTLPLFLEMNEFRLVHACWDNQSIKSIEHKLTTCKTMPDEFINKASKKGTPEFKAIEILLKGRELKLPHGNTYKDQYEHSRDHIRVKWWEQNAKTYRDYALVHQEALDKIPDDKLDSNDIADAYSDPKPVFFGHYWFTGEPEILKDNAVCLDFSVAKKEKLVCYRWNTGDTKLSNNNFTYVDAE